jgi:salicylate hydroxylase
MLYNLAVSAGVTVSFNALVTSVSVDQSTKIPQVRLASGEVLNADVIVGADGSSSVTRQAVTGSTDDGVDSGMSGVT